MTVAAKTKPTAREKLDLSRLRVDQMHGLGDVDVSKLVVRLGRVKQDIRAAVTDGTLERTIEGASTLTFSVLDPDLSLLRSGILKRGAEIELDGLYFRLCALKKQERSLDIVFEEREINLLRGEEYSRPKMASRAKVTRAEFVLGLLREVKEVRIRYVIPELHKVQPIEKAVDASGAVTPASGGGYGFAPKPSEASPEDVRGNYTLTIKGYPATNAQLRNAAAILSAGIGLSVRRKLLVCAMMTAIQESTMRNLPGGDRDSVGLFQQRASWGSYRDRHDPPTAARMFFKRAMRIDGLYPDLDYTDLCQEVQNSATPNAYASWRDEGEKLVSAYGAPGGDSEANARGSNTSYDDTEVATTPYTFYRGVPPNKQKGTTKWGRESSWTCITRLAEEVNWRAFEIAGAIYFIDEEYLFKSRPIMTITDESTGIDSIDGDYDENKPQGQLTINAHLKRWKAPPGSVIQIFKMGPWDGRWLVSDISRSIFDDKAEITLKKPAPALPEPAQSDLQDAGWGGNTGAGSQGERFQYATALVKPIPKLYFTHQGAVHQTMGLPGYPAIDFFAKPGSPIIAPEPGVITRLSGQDPILGPPQGVGGPLGWSVYLHGNASGTTYFITHMGKRYVRQGQAVNEADVIGTVADYDTYGGKGFSHAHVGCSGGEVSIGMLGDAPAAVKG